MNNSSGVPAVEPLASDDLLRAADIFGLLADPGRLRILLRLHEGEANVGQLSAHCGMSESATSHALRLLRAHDVVRVRRLGRMAFYELADAHVRNLLETALAHLRHAADVPALRLHTSDDPPAEQP